MTGTPTCRRGIGKSFTPYVLESIVFYPLRLVLKSHAVEGGSRLSKQWGERASWKRMAARNSVERLMASVIWSRENPRFLDIVYPSFVTDYSVVC